MVRAVINRTLDMKEQGVIELEKNISTVMKDTDDGLKVNDNISIPKYLILGEGARKLMYGTISVCIIYDWNDRLMNDQEILSY